MRKRRILVAALAAGTVALGAGGAALATLSTPAATASTSETGSQTTTAPRLGETKIKQIALEFASRMGDPNPTSIEYVQGSRQQVVFGVSKDEVPDDTEVDAIVMHGQFAANNVSLPIEGNPPSGPVLIVFVNAATGAMTDLGIQQQAPNLNPYGPVHTVE